MSLPNFSSTSIVPSTKVYRQQLIEGVSIPAIFQNGAYFFRDLLVYEDGRVNAWAFRDWEHFKKAVEETRITPNIPDDKEISVYG